MKLLKFSPANSKLKHLYKSKKLSQWIENNKKIYSLDLLSGHSCPFAYRCKSMAVETEEGLRIKDGPATLFRCFSASQEVLLPYTYKSRKHNFELLCDLNPDWKRMYGLITKSLPKNAGIIRIHAAGDFFSADYFYSWLQVAKNNPSILFYTYTKSLSYWIKYRSEIPSNFVLTASRGGRQDKLIDTHGLRNATVVYSPEQSKYLKLPIDKTDEYAATNSGNFLLLLHGIQPKDSEASSALEELKKKGIKFSYNKKTIV